MSAKTIIKLVETVDELEQILSLQTENHIQNLSLEDRKTNGFVTVRHNIEILTKMNSASKQIIAKNGDNVVGYALVMPKEFSDLIPILKPMFDMFENLTYKQRKLKNIPYYVMGQICIAKNYRGIGIFEQLYMKHKETYSSRFEICLTEVSNSNLRSMQAHEKVGFKVIHNFDDKTDNWNILLWDWE